jgi:hypothetical protein
MLTAPPKASGRFEAKMGGEECQGAGARGLEQGYAEGHVLRDAVEDHGGQ